MLRQPQWREYVLAETQRRIDSLRVLEEAPPGPHPPGVEELAFAVWSATDLAAFGFSSAVEIQDAGGRRDQPLRPEPAVAAGAAGQPCPRAERWEVSRETG